MVTDDTAAVICLVLATCFGIPVHPDELAARTPEMVPNLEKLTNA